MIGLHLAGSAALVAFGTHRTYLARRYRRPRRLSPAADTGRRPRVTVQLPLYNERYVADRVIAALAALDYPRDRLEIQVLDDSTDETTDRVREAVTRWRRRGVSIQHLRRGDRRGFKAGALAYGLARARGDLIAVFDADFVPQTDYLTRLVAEFDDPEVGMVQARWGHLNEGHSLLTRAQALQLDAHFIVEHGVRHGAHLFFNFNGTAGIWRRTAIDDAGGWQADTLTEDLDLSYRAQLRGWRFVYRNDVVVPAELPVEIAAYRQQQARWAQGGIQAARKLLPAVWRAAIPGRVKREATWHLLAHLAYPLLVVVTGAGLAAGLIAPTLPGRFVLALDGLLLTFAMGAMAYFYGVAAGARSGRVWTRRLFLVPAIMILGAGIALGQTAAVFRGLAGYRTPFRRTPKYHVDATRSTGWRRAAYRLDAVRPAAIDCALGCTVLAAGAAQALHLALPPSGLAVLFGVGFLVVGGTALAQSLG